MAPTDLKPFKIHYPDGTLRYEAFLNDRDLPEGKVVMYYSNGRMEMETHYVNGKPHGEVRCWDREANLLDSYVAVNGNGVWRTWHGNGRPKGQGQTRDGLSDGKVVLWDEDGKKLSTTYHIKGGEVKKQRYLAAMAKDPTLPPID